MWRHPTKLAQVNKCFADDCIEIIRMQKKVCLYQFSCRKHDSYLKWESEIWLQHWFATTLNDSNILEHAFWWQQMVSAWLTRAVASDVTAAFCLQFKILDNTYTVDVCEQKRSNFLFYFRTLTEGINLLWNHALNRFLSPCSLVQSTERQVKCSQALNIDFRNAFEVNWPQLSPFRNSNDYFVLVVCVYEWIAVHMHAEISTCMHLYVHVPDYMYIVWDSHLLIFRFQRHWPSWWVHERMHTHQHLSSDMGVVLIIYSHIILYFRVWLCREFLYS